MDKLTIVVDTNVLIVMFSRKHPYHTIKQAIFDGTVRLAISNDILMKYAERLQRRLSILAPKLVNALADLPNSIHVDPHFNYLLISVDPDDNKFADCAININADYLVSDDAHFRVLADVEFPNVVVVTGDQFLSILNT